MKLKKKRKEAGEKQFLQLISLTSNLDAAKLAILEQKALSSSADINCQQYLQEGEPYLGAVSLKYTIVQISPRKIRQYCEHSLIDII